ncbi:hypothetical protein ACFQDE_03150 [Deinococcus caeni]|uniref:hypothetical protein n=1 Tax=Deinococcus caeni TaxID=569127 RepID=UPI00360D9FE2
MLRAQLSDGEELTDLPLSGWPLSDWPLTDPSVTDGPLAGLHAAAPHALNIGPPHATLGRLWLAAPPARTPTPPRRPCPSRRAPPPGSSN